MIDFDQLLEFEELLSSTSVHKTAILLENLELKMEHLQCSDDTPPRPEFTRDDLTQVFDDYDISTDEFVTCPKCGNGLMRSDGYKQCCKAFVYNSSQITSQVETTYWLAFINNPATTISLLPYYNQLLCLQQGIPTQLRLLVWERLFLLDLPQLPELLREVFDNLQHLYNLDISKQISKDLNRTFPLVQFFKQEDTVAALNLVLNVYANFDAELGYCQGLLFLVGVLFFHFGLDSQMTFHALICIMDMEPELRNIFTTGTMLETLSAWEGEFKTILAAVDPELSDHLTGFVEMKLFLYQWWMLFMLSHLPDLLIVNRIMDFCMIQGWKTGLLKISLGLLLSNKPILMAVGPGDDEVVYQHLLNELKWGNVINNLDLFFGDLLLLWDDVLFTTPTPPTQEPAAEPLMVGKMLASIAPSFASAPSPAPAPAASPLRDRAGLDSLDAVTQLLALVFSKHATKNDLELIYLDMSGASDNYKLFTDYLRLPLYALLKKLLMVGPPTLDYEGFNLNLVSAENEGLKQLLRSAQQLLEDSNPQAAALKAEITRVLG